MEVIYFMVPIALILSAGGLAGFIWATKGGQYDDVQTPALRMLNDDNQFEIQNKNKVKTKTVKERNL